jgi:UDP-N-acetylglucosamine--N-acetylmuramyl-(pentapeptide) pyrophosphoryl-undecaprenol N-acetylglucosamine transferase
MAQFDLKEPAPGKGLYISSSGGHFAELIYIANRFNATSDSILITFASSDTQNLNSNFKIQHIPYIKPRKIWPLVRVFPAILSVLRRNRFDYIASTGASIAIVGYLAAKILRLPFFYVESIARQSTLSLTANLLRILGLPAMFVQSSKLLNQSSVYLEHPIKRYRIEEKPIPEKLLRAKVFVTLGTIRGYEFERAIDMVLSILDGSEIVVWQTGSTIKSNLPGEVHIEMDKDSFLNQIDNADIVICHAGIGIITDCLKLGKVPLVIPRRAKHAEVDMLVSDHLIVNLEINTSKTPFQDVLRRKVILD